MRISVTAKPRAHAMSVVKIDDTRYVVAVKEPPIDGRANTAIEIALADYFHVAPSRVCIVFGHTSRQKVIEIIGV
ncbi:DUF167 domain-containing protein [Candidatus Uhrbacteria bacterium]|nr:DUF167 domain-containing protein [Candidatus Uhrbacteria bacterium]